MAMSKEAKREYDRKYYLENKKRKKDLAKKFYDENKEHVLNRCKEYRKNNYKKVSDMKKAYYYNNREVILESQKEYNRNNPEKIRANNSRYFNRKRKSRILGFTKEMQEIYEMAIEIEMIDGIKREVHHIVPLRQDPNVCGLDVSWNLDILTKEEHLEAHRVISENIRRRDYENK